MADYHSHPDPKQQQRVQCWPPTGAFEQAQISSHLKAYGAVHSRNRYHPQWSASVLFGGQGLERHRVGLTARDLCCYSAKSASFCVNWAFSRTSAAGWPSRCGGSFLQVRASANDLPLERLFPFAILQTVFKNLYFFRLTDSSSCQCGFRHRCELRSSLGEPY